MTLTAANLVRIGAGFICMPAVVICGVWATEVYWKIIDKVNSRLPEAEKFRPLFWGPVKRFGFGKSTVACIRKAMNSQKSTA